MTNDNQNKLLKISSYFLFKENNMPRLRLQKYLWYFNLMYFFKNNELYFTEDTFQAWRYGPINPFMWDYSSNHIFSPSDLLKPNDQMIKKYCDFIWDLFNETTLETLYLLNIRELASIYKSKNYDPMELKSISITKDILKSNEKNLAKIKKSLMSYKGDK